MLILGKSLLPVLITIAFLHGCGYKSPNSDEFPHKHITELTPSQQGVQFEWFKSENPIGLRSITPKYITYDCSEKTLNICSYNLNRHKKIVINIPQTEKNQSIDSITALSENIFVITVETRGNNSDEQYSAYILNSDTQQLIPTPSFSYIEFSQKILEQLTHEGIYQKEKNQNNEVIYLNKAYVTNKEEVQKKIEEKQNNQSLWQSFKDMLNIKADRLPDDYSPLKFQVTPPEPFNKQFTVQFKQYLAQQPIKCYYILNGRLINYALLKTPQSYILSIDFESKLDQIMNTFKIPSCQKYSEPSTVTEKYIKYQSIDNTYGSGNHFIFWFTPVGYDVFEIKQHGKIKQFKFPIDSAWMYQVNNDLIIINNQTYYIVPIS